MNPKISVITISYNNREGLEKTLKSVTSQDYKDFEYIVMDGGSNDGSKEILEKYSDKISYWISEPDKGIYNAMNKGIVAAKGEYLLFLNSGDEFFQNSVLKNISPNLHSFDIIAGDLEFVYRNKRQTEKNPDEISFKTFVEGTIYHPCTFIKKNAFIEIGLYDEQLKIVSDWKWFMLALCNYKKTYKHFNIIISKFFFDGISSNKDNLHKIESERKKVLTTLFAIFYYDYEKFIETEKKYHALIPICNNYNQLLKSRIIILLKKIGFFKNFNTI